MKIGIDARLMERRMTGIGRYLSSVLKYIPECDKENEYILFSYRPLPGFPRANVRNVATLDGRADGRLQKIRSLLWLHRTLPRFLKKENIDVFFSPNQLLPFGTTHTKNIITIHDVFQLVNPKFHSPVYRSYVSLALARSLRKSTHIITVSESSKRDIMKLLHVPAEKITVIYEAADPRFAPMALGPDDCESSMKKYGLPPRFILYVGVIEERKNIKGMIEIADRMRGKTDVPIVLAGRIGYGGAKYIAQIKERGNMMYCGFIEEEDLPALYNLADAFLFPSLYEGFGLPPLEAMQSGLPVVASNTSSLPEVIGDAGILLPPYDSGAFADAIISLLSDENKRALLKEKGIARAKEFSFLKTARETVTLLTSR